VCPGPKNQALAGFYDGNELYEICTSPKNSDWNVCVGYVSAIYDVIMKVDLFDYRSCLPQKYIMSSQVKDIVASWLQRNPQHRHYSSPSIVAAALAEAFPCKN
jgi:hypothetical protein